MEIKKTVDLTRLVRRQPMQVRLPQVTNNDKLTDLVYMSSRIIWIPKQEL